MLNITAVPTCPDPVMTEHNPPNTILDTFQPHFGQPCAECLCLNWRVALCRNRFRSRLWRSITLQNTFWTPLSLILDRLQHSVFTTLALPQFSNLLIGPVTAGLELPLSLRHFGESTSITLSIFLATKTILDILDTPAQNYFNHWGHWGHWARNSYQRINAGIPAIIRWFSIHVLHGEAAFSYPVYPVHPC